MKKIFLILILFPALIFGQATGYVISNKSIGGAIGTASSTVDVLTNFNLNQTTAGQTLTVPNLTNASAGKIIYINNIGSVSLTLSPGGILPVGYGVILRWDGVRWNINSNGNQLGGATGSTGSNGNTGSTGTTGYTGSTGSTGASINEHPIRYISGNVTGIYVSNSVVTDSSYNAFPAGIQCADSSLLVLYSSDSIHGIGHSLKMSRSTDGGDTWTAPLRFLSAQIGTYLSSGLQLSGWGDTLMTPVNWIFPGAIEKVYTIMSTDNGVTWSDTSHVVSGFGTAKVLSTSKVLHQSNGVLWLPVYADSANGGYIRMSKSIDHGVTWSDVGVIVPYKNYTLYEEPCISEMPNGTYTIAIRTIEKIYGGYNMFQIYSSDLIHWSKPVRTLKNILGSPSIFNSPSGEMCIITRDSVGGINEGYPVVNFSNDGINWYGRQYLNYIQNGCIEEYGQFVWNRNTNELGCVFGTQTCVNLTSSVYFQKFSKLNQVIPDNKNRTYGEEILASNPCTYWNLNDAIGAVAHDSVGIIDLKVNDSVKAQEYGGIPNDPTSSMYFSGNDSSYVSGNYNPIFRLVGQSMTFECLIKWTDSGTDGFLVSVVNPSTDYQWFIRIIGGVLRYSGGSGTSTNTDTTVITKNVWHHIAVRFDRYNEIGDGNVTISFFVDGIKSTTDTYTESGIAPTNIFLGCAYPGTGKFKGYMQNVAIYNQPLTNKIILEHAEKAGF